MKRLGALAAAVTVVAAACSGGSTLDLTAEQRQAVAVDGWNQTGRTDLDVDAWVEIVTEVCRDDPDSETTRARVVEAWGLDRLVPTDDAIGSLWLIAIQVCRDRFPEEHQLPEGHPAG